VIASVAKESSNLSGYVVVVNLGRANLIGGPIKGGLTNFTLPALVSEHFVKGFEGKPIVPAKMIF
jgi:hypothetical protein